MGFIAVEVTELPSSQKEVKITLLNNYIQWRSTFFLMIADFGCVRLSTPCRIWLLFAIEA